MIWTWLAEKIGAPLLKIGGLVLAVLAALAYVRKTGADAARGEQAVEDANAAKRAAAVDTYRADGELDKRLRDGSF